MESETMTINVKYDESRITLSPRMVAALIELMKAECELMGRVDDDKSLWHWGRCHVSDMSNRDGFSFEFGPHYDVPDDGLGRFGIASD